MKNLFKTIFTITLSCIIFSISCLITGNYSFADNWWDYPEYESDNFIYYVSNNEAIVRVYKGNDTNIIIPAYIDGYKVKKIAGEAFMYNNMCKTVHIPATVEEIGVKPFYQCYNLEYISVDKYNKYFASYNGVLYSKDKTRLLTCPAKKSAPISIEYGVENIDMLAFDHCANLKRLVLPKTLKTIGGQAFSHSSLESITIPSSVNRIDTEYLGEEAECDFGYIFNTCYKLKDIWLKKYSYAYNFLSDKYQRQINLINDESTLDIYNENYPTTIAQGNSFTLKGTIKSNYKLSSVTVQVLNSDKEQISTASKTVYPEDKIYTQIDSGIKFGLLPVGNYTYQVIATDVSGKQKLLIDNDFNVVKQSITVNNVTGLKFTSTTSSVKLSWNKTSGASGYEVWKYNASTGVYSKVKTITSSSTTSYYQSNFSSATMQRYKIRAYKTVNGVKYYGEFTNEFLTGTKPLTPQLTATAGTKKATLKWTNTSSRNTGYQVYRATSKTGTYKKIKTTTLKSYTNTGLTKGKYYYYKVRAYRTLEDGTVIYGSYSAVKSVKAK